MTTSYHIYHYTTRNLHTLRKNMNWHRARTDGHDESRGRPLTRHIVASPLYITTCKRCIALCRRRRYTLQNYMIERSNSETAGPSHGTFAARDDPPLESLLVWAPNDATRITHQACMTPGIQPRIHSRMLIQKSAYTT